MRGFFIVAYQDRERSFVRLPRRSSPASLRFRRGGSPSKSFILRLTSPQERSRGVPKEYCTKNHFKTFDQFNLIW